MNVFQRARAAAGEARRFGPQAVDAADRTQRRWPVFGFPLAILRKFNIDQAGNLAALIAYYGFLALFPLLLLLTTVLDILLKNDPHLRDELINSALAQYPVIGQTIRQQQGSLPASGLPLVFGALFLLFGARGVANAMQNALCSVWGIARKDRPNFLVRQLWGLALILTVGVGFILTTFLSGLAGGAGRSVFTGAAAHVGAVAVSFVLNVGMFWLGFRLATLGRVRWRNLLTGAAIAAAVWTALQLAGGYVVAHQLHRSSELYGSFGLVLGLLAWLYLQAEITLYAAEADVVVAKKLWPVPLAGADEGAAVGSPAAAASEPARPGVPGPRQAGEDRAGSTVHGDGKAGTDA